MQLYFIRHGQSQNNARWNGTSYDGPRYSDPELTTKGVEQAKSVAQFISTDRREDRFDLHNASGFGITHIYCSLMVRAIETGTTIANSLALPLQVWQDIHEVGGITSEDQETGEQTGLPGNNRAYIEERYPNLVLPDSLTEDGWWNRPYEEVEERLPRAQLVLASLLERHGDTDDRVVFVSHGGFYNFFFMALFKLPARDRFWVAMGNCAISRFDFFENGSIGMLYSNRAEFLAPDLLGW